MTDRQPEPEAEATDETPNVKQMRERIEELTAENKQFKTDKRADVFKAAGFDTSTGVGKLLANAYDGEPTVEALVAYAKGEGIEPPNPDVKDPSTPPAPTAEQTLVREGDQRLDNLQSSTTPVTAPTEQDEIRQAELDGDHMKSLHLKNLQLLEMEKDRK